MILFDNVKYRYQYEQFELFKGLSFTLQQGVNTILCGAQSGKSSICKLLCNDISPQQGSITMDGQMLPKGDNGVLWLPKCPTFFENRTLLYNVAYPLKVRKVEKSRRLAEASKIVLQFDLDPKQKVKKLSFEQKKKLAIARALTCQRKVVLLDDFCKSVQEIEQIVTLFPIATVVVLTSNVSLAVGNTILLDGGVCLFEGESSIAQQQATQLLGFDNTTQQN